MESIRKEIEKGNARFAEYVRKGDASALASLYTEDARLMPTNSPMIVGRNKVEEFWGSAIPGLAIKDAVLKTVDLVGEGDTVTELGEYTLKVHPEGREPAEDKGKYVVMWKKTPEGWKLHWDIFNTSLPPT